MRFVHTSDWHLGKLFHGVHLTEDQAHVLDQLIGFVRESKPDVVIVAGDVYDRAVPPPEAVRLLNETVSQIVLGLRVPMVIIAGNHDSPERLAFGSQLLAEQNLHIVTGFDCTPLRFEDADGAVNVFALPYAEPAVVRERLGLEDVHDHDAAMQALTGLAKAARPKGERSVLVAHAFVAGGKASESERPLSVGGAGNVAKVRFSGFDYIALGHLHRPQSVGKALHYAGSLLKYSFSEAGHDKSIKLVEMDGKGKCSIEEVRLAPLRDVRTIKGYLSEILERPAARSSRDDYMMVTLLDRGAILDAMGKLRQVFPNVLHIDRPQLGVSENVPGRGVDHRQLDEEGLFAAFFAEVTGEDLTSDQRTVFREVAERVRRQEREVSP